MTDGPSACNAAGHVALQGLVLEATDLLREGAEVVVATPGRLIDLMEEGCCALDQVSFLVLDEADRMLDQGFERAIRQIIAATHPERQTCLFSATWPEQVHMYL